MSDGIDATEVTPGLAIAAAELFHNYQTKELEEIASIVDAELFTASSIQLTLMVIDWVALNEIGDAIAIAYENDDRKALEELERKGARFSIDEDGILNSWLVENDSTPQAFDFPLDFWTQIKFAVQAHAETASKVLGLPVKVINELAAGIINDGIIKLLAGENEVAVPSAAKFFKEDPVRASYAVVATNAFITASVLEEAAKSRTYALQASIPDSEPITYEYVAETIRQSLRNEMLEDS